ncbi:MAG: type IX secretion system sortase PorU [Marinilabiliaceae bacterium]|nr:type IX secretion system sortase PorU [Marinilabiliaceae bacterium]
MKRACSLKTLLFPIYWETRMKIFFLLSLFILAHIQKTIAQITSVSNVSKYFIWDDNSNITPDALNVFSFSFNDYSLREDLYHLPAHEELMPLDSWNPLSDSISISISHSDNIFVTPLENNFLQKKNVKKNIISHDITFISGKPHLRVTIFPFIIDTTRNYYKKINFIQLKIAHTHIKNSNLKQISSNYANNSLLANGKWVKIKITKTGVHKIPYSLLSEWGFSNPAKVKVYGMGGKMLPENNSVERGDDMILNRSLHTNNAIYFYASGPVQWKFNSSKNMFVHTIHHYTDEAYYFLSEQDENAEIENAENFNLTPNNTITAYDYYTYHETNKTLLIKSGRTWYGEIFTRDILNTQSFQFNIPDLELSSNVRVAVDAISRSNLATSYNTYINNHLNPIASMSIAAVNIYKTDSFYAQSGTCTGNFIPDSENITVKLKYNASSEDSKGYLDKINIQGKRLLKYNGTQFSFRDYSSIGSENITNFTISSTDPSIQIWDVTEAQNPKVVNTNKASSTVSFNYCTPELKEFVAFSLNENLPSPEFAENISNQNLHGLPQIDYLIITPDDDKIKAQANILAQLHQDYNNLTTAVVTQKQIFNEFSSGQPDIVAIRSFARMFYKRANGNEALKPKYILLFGDGSYDNKSTVNNTNLILTYQSDNSIHYIQSYTADDFYGILDDSEGDNLSAASLDIGIGRFPIKNENEAINAVNKVRMYLTSQQQSPWKTKIAFIGDDGDGVIHMSAADYAAQKIETNNPEFEIQKIYLDAYPKKVLSNGSRYPDVEKAIDKAVNEGILIFNYSGHGGEKGLAHEQIVTIERIRAWSNLTRLPLFLTATCEFSRYDDKLFTSAGEEVFLNPDGGAIALLTTSRIVYSSQNKTLNDNFYDFAFVRDENNNKLRLGDILKKTKNKSGATINKLNFTLLGDPALQLCYPDNAIKPVILNNNNISSSDTLKALSINTITSKTIPYENRNEAIVDDFILTDFNGDAKTTLYDKPVTITTLGNAGNKQFTYNTYQNILFKGSSAVENGNMTNIFVIPKDINYNYGKGRFSFYASSTQGNEAFGSYNITIGGTDTGTGDNQGPDIEMLLNSEAFKNGQTVNTTPLLIANLSDENGINASGSGIGHDLVLTLDDGSVKHNLNSYFESKKDDYKNGSIYFQLPELTTGKHTLTLKAWDTYNNSSESTISFNVSSSDNLSVTNVSMYPNPLLRGETIYLTFNHDAPNTKIHTTINIYSINGSLVYSEEEKIASETASALIEIDDTRFFLPGIYMIHILLNTESGKNGTICQKIVVIK